MTRCPRGAGRAGRDSTSSSRLTARRQSRSRSSVRSTSAMRPSLHDDAVIRQQRDARIVSDEDEDLAVAAAKAPARASG